MRTVKIILASFSLATVLVGFQNMSRPDSPITFAKQTVHVSSALLATFHMPDPGMTCALRE